MSDSIKKLLKQYQLSTSGKYISEEFQDYAYRLAMDLSGPEDRSAVEDLPRMPPEGFEESHHPQQGHL